MPNKSNTVFFTARSTALVLAIAMLSGVILSGCLPVPIDLLPEARFTATPRVGNVPLEVHFRDTSEANGGTIYAWVWDFGDGVRSTAPNPSHTYTRPGEFEVTLTVTTAQGADTLVAQRYVTTQLEVEFDEIGPAGGTAAAKGLRLDVPAGVLPETVAYGMRFADGFYANIPETYAYLSTPVRLQHNGTSPRLYGPNGATINHGSLTLAYNNTSILPENRVPAKVMILCRTPEGLVFPIAGTLQGNTITTPVINLPHDATYIVVYRPEAYGVDFDADKSDATKATTGLTWKDDWTVFTSDAFLQQMTALRVGEIFSPLPYERRDFTVGQLDTTLNEILNALDAIQFEYDLAGMRAPVLTQPNNVFTLVFFNSSDFYNSGYTRFADLQYRSRMFGSIVIDPLQLLTIARHNDAIVREDLFENVDLVQEMSFANAFAQELFEAAYDGYDYPPVLVSPPGAPPVDMLDGLRRGLSTYLGQRAAGLDMSRTFDPAERIDAGVTLLNPILGGDPEYGNANQDFFLWVERVLDTAKGGASPFISYLMDSSPPSFGVLEQIRLDLEAALAGDPEMPLELLLTTVGGAFDEGLLTKEGVTLGELYKDFAQELGVENTLEAQVRPSDARRTPRRLQEDRFSETKVELDVDTLNAATPTGFLVPPLTTIALVLAVHPDADTLELVFNPLDWSESNGNSVAVTAYRGGLPGIERPALSDTIVVSSLIADAGECTQEVVVLVSNANPTGFNFVSVVATATGTPGSSGECSPEI